MQRIVKQYSLNGNESVVLFVSLAPGRTTVALFSHRIPSNVSTFQNSEYIHLYAKRRDISQLCYDMGWLFNNSVSSVKLCTVE
jgi:hypothetical protein